MAAMTLSSVLLPEPDAPITATNSPFSTEKLTPASARVTALPLPKYLTARSTRKISCMANTSLRTHYTTGVCEII